MITAARRRGRKGSLGLSTQLPRFPGKLTTRSAAEGRKFANQKALIDYAEQNGLVYVWGWIERQRVISPAFTKRKRLLSPDEYEIVDVRTSRGVRTAMLFPKAILQAEFAANAPLREVLAIQRERWRVKRAAKQ